MLNYVHTIYHRGHSRPMTEAEFKVFTGVLIAFSLLGVCTLLYASYMYFFGKPRYSWSKDDGYWVFVTAEVGFAGFINAVALFIWGLGLLISIGYGISKLIF